MAIVVLAQTTVFAAEDTAPDGGTLHLVDLLATSFSPDNLSINVGDTVRWTNNSGLHNVFSCIPTQTGCNGEQANETFGSGAASTFWVYDYTFTQPGLNPYVCQPHAAIGMTGLITVVAGPPPVPDGTFGTAMTVGKLDATGATLSLDWDVATCTGASGHHVVYGFGARLPSVPGGPYRPAGAACSITAPTYTWSGAPDPSTDTSNLLWWVVVTDDASSVEGSWGADSFDNERNSPFPGGVSNRCAMTTKAAPACFP